MPSLGMIQDNWNCTRERDHRSMDEIREDNITKAIKWIKERDFEVIRVGTPKDREFFVNYEIKEDCWYYFFMTEDRKILQAEYTQLYGADEMVTNFDERYRYYVVKKCKT